MLSTPMLLRHACLASLLFTACASGRSQTTAPDAPAVSTPSAATVQDPPPPAAASTLEPGTRELVRELGEADSIQAASDRFHKKTAIVRKIRALADPRGRDALSHYVTAKPAPSVSTGEHAHFRTEVAFALAEVGDARAIPILAERLAQDPLQLYDDSEQQLPLKRHDQERVVAARLIADLAALHPELDAAQREAAAKGIRAWIAGQPEPHANAMRAFARLGISDDATLRQLLAWANPKTLPRRGAQPPFPSEFSVAQPALRYLGAAKHPKALEVLKKQLTRRPKGFDATMDGLMLGGSAILGMSLRALGVGAAQGFSELGDARAVPWLLAYIDDDQENEQSREEACLSLAWLVTGADDKELVKRLTSWSAANRTKATDFRLACLLDGLAVRSSDALVAPLLATLDASIPNGPIARAAAVALGRRGLDSATEGALLAKLRGAHGAHAALALALGGSPSAIAQLRKHAVSEDDPWFEALATAYQEANIGVYSDDVTSGRLFRWVDNANALAERESESFPLALHMLRRKYLEAEYDSGPRSLTRVLLRGRLIGMAEKPGPDAKRAIAALALFGERGSLLALAERPETRAEAERALSRLTPPPAIEGN
jgi:hypothetical protein